MQLRMMHRHHRLTAQFTMFIEKYFRVGGGYWATSININ